MDVSKLEAALIDPTKATRQAADAKAQPSAGKEGGFTESFGELIANTNQDIQTAEASARELAAGKGDVVETMIDLNRADLSLRMVVNLRNRMLEAYQEVMRLQV